MSTPGTIRYRFDDVEIDPRGFRATKAGRVLPLEPKALNVLIFLVENRGRLVEKSELLNAVWGEAFVTENVLTRAIAQLRKALVDDAKDARFIETVPTKGYRFVAEVSVTEPERAELIASILGSDVQTAPALSSAQAVASRLSTNHRYTIAALVCLATLVAAGVVYFARSHSTLRLLRIANSTQVTTSSGLSFYPTFSPNGSEIAYCTDRGKGFELFVRQLTSGGKEVQVTSDGNQNMQPTWSPDGNFIAYHSKTRGGIWVIPSLGGSPRKLTDFGSRPAWSRDGQWIAFQSGPVADIGADSVSITPTSTIWKIRPDGSDATQVTHLGQPSSAQGSPSWSPNSKHIVFATIGPTEIWAAGADGSTPTRIAEPAFRYYDPAYSADGKNIVFGGVARSTDPQTYGLFQVPVSLDTSAPIGPTGQILNSNGVHLKHFNFSADNKKLIYSAETLTSTLESLPLSKSGEPLGESVALTSNVGCRTTEPAFSPDGKRIAYESCLGRSGLTQQIWLMDANGNNAHQISEGTQPKLWPSWYPNGKEVLFMSTSEKKLLSVDIDSLQQKVVTTMDRQFDHPQISPAGKVLAAAMLAGGILNIWTMELPGGQPKQITFEKEMGGFPAWSPDGKFIALESQRGPDNNITIVPSTGGQSTPLTSYHGQQWLHGWSSDGDRVLFAKPDDNFVWNIWSVSRSTKLEKQLTHYLKSNTYVRYPAASPVGGQIVFEYTETTGNIWMADLQ